MGELDYAQECGVNWDDIEGGTVAFNGSRQQQGGGKPKYQHKQNHGALFDNERKEKETQPDMTGTIDVDGRTYWISGWKNMTDSGKKKLALAVTLQEERPVERQQAPQQRRQSSGW